jgi:hypothetical protein
LLASAKPLRLGSRAFHALTEKAQAVVEEIKKAGGQAIAVQGDVTAADFPKKLIKATIE